MAARAQVPLLGKPADATMSLQGATNPGTMVTQHNEHEAALDLVTDATHTSAGGLATGLIAAPATYGAATGTLQSALSLVFPIDLADAAGANYDFTTPDKIEIVGVQVIKFGAGAANTVQLKTTGGTAITDAIAADTDKAATRAATIDRATSAIAAGAAFRVTTVRAAGSAAMRVLVYVLKLT